MRQRFRRYSCFQLLQLPARLSHARNAAGNHLEASTFDEEKGRNLTIICGWCLVSPSILLYVKYYLRLIVAAFAEHCVLFSRSPL